MKQEHNNEMDLLLRNLGRTASADFDVERSQEEHLDADELNAYAEKALPAAAHARYTKHIADCARCRKIAAELGVAAGVITEADHAAWTKEQVKPYVAHAIDCFGFDRVMYGSDWTVSELTHEYPTWVAILDEVVAGSSKADIRKLYRDNAIRIYHLPA